LGKSRESLLRPWYTVTGPASAEYKSDWTTARMGRSPRL
jgi:hypothetical protein